MITTRTIAPGALPGGPADRRSRRDAGWLATLADRQINFDPSDQGAVRVDRRWRIDDMVEPLPQEGSGPPAQGGSWEVARELMDSYQLADPGVVTAFYDSTRPLIGDVEFDLRAIHDLRRGAIFNPDRF